MMCGLSNLKDAAVTTVDDEFPCLWSSSGHCVIVLGALCGYPLGRVRSVGRSSQEPCLNNPARVVRGFCVVTRGASLMKQQPSGGKDALVDLLGRWVGLEPRGFMMRLYGGQRSRVWSEALTRVSSFSPPEASTINILRPA